MIFVNKAPTFTYFVSRIDRGVITISMGLFTMITYGNIVMRNTYILLFFFILYFFMKFR